MLFILGSVIGGAYMGWSFIMSTNSSFYRVDTSTYVFAGVFAVLLGVCGAFIGVGVAWLVGRLFPRIWTDPTTFKLASMNNGTSMTGSFYLMHGSVRGGWSYRYYVKIGDTLHPSELSVYGNDITIHEVPNEKDPRMVVETFRVRYGWLKLFGFSDEDRRYQFYLQKGSVKQGFDI